ncbi:MAG: endonuclease MutS2 [Chloroherpetonaceae bacterium]|nr:endonuclease MutS2 [Chloroherpetonaceae bacterium]
MKNSEKIEFDKIQRFAETLCISDMGRSKLEIEQPFLSATALQFELKKTAELKLLMESGEELPILSMPDTRIIYQKLTIENNFLFPKELLAVGVSLRLSSQLKKFIFNRRETYPNLNQLTENLWMEKSLQHEISRIIDDFGEVKNTASDALSDIRSRLANRRDSLRRKFDALQRRYAEKNMLMEEGVTIRNGRLVLGFRVEHKYSVQGFIHDLSQSGHTVFIEPAETLMLSNEIRELEIEEIREIERILREVARDLRAYLENLLSTQEILSQFDALYAKARLAIMMRAVLPNFSETKALRLINAYHPWLYLSNRNTGKSIEPLSLELGANSRTLVITGPNAGGKSVALKTLGLLSEMLRHGYLLPCREDSHLTLFDQIFVEIGDEQSIENDLSTFSSHLRNLKFILDEATNESLVLIDEICSGTDPDEGAAIAIGVLESLLVRNALTVVTTHQGTLKAYAHQKEGVINGSMQFDSVELRPTYRFQVGVPGSSFALEMAKRMGFAPHILKNAEIALGESKHALEELIINLNSELQKTIEERTTLRSENERLKRLTEQVEKSKLELERERKDLRRQSMAEGKRLLAEANALIEKAIRDIKSSQADPEVIKQSRRSVEDMRKSVAKDTEPIVEKTILDSQFRPGDKVKLIDSQTFGEILEVSDEDAFVSIGNFRLKTALRNLEKISSKDARELSRKDAVETPKNYGGISIHEIKDFSTRLDLRGKTGEEAITDVARFIDGAIQNGLISVDIIHGKGTGALRKRISDYLKSDRRVKSFRLGNWDEGGTGATIVELSQN